jgi:hypothetical protein
MLLMFFFALFLVNCGVWSNDTFEISQATTKPLGSIYIQYLQDPEVRNQLGIKQNDDLNFHQVAVTAITYQVIDTAGKTIPVNYFIQELDGVVPPGMIDTASGSQDFSADFAAGGYKGVYIYNKGGDLLETKNSVGKICPESALNFCPLEVGDIVDVSGLFTEYPANESDDTKSVTEITMDYLNVIGRVDEEHKATPLKVANPYKFANMATLGQSGICDEAALQSLYGSDSEAYQQQLALFQEARDLFIADPATYKKEIESFEGVLLEFDNVIVMSDYDSKYAQFMIAGCILVEIDTGISYVPEGIGENILSLTGVLHASYGQYRILPVTVTLAEQE